MNQTDRIIELVAQHLEIEPAQIAEADLFVEDHGADSLAMIDLLAALEREFRVNIDEDELARMVSVRGVRLVLADATGW